MNLLLQKLQGRKVAIVGNGNVSEDYSSEIDAADVVVRFNHFYNYDSGKVGRRVDIVLQTITPMYFDAKNRHDDIVRAQRPHVFLVKNHFTYDTNLHKVYGDAVRVENTTRFFDAYAPYTTGTTALAYLADKLTNAEVRCYGFQDEADWRRYLATDAKNFGVRPDERGVMLDSIKRLESLKITDAYKGIDRCIVVPVKQNSTGAPGKNRALLSRCLEELKACKIPITVVGDDTELLSTAHGVYGVDVCPLPSIGSFVDVTETLRQWRVRSGYVGDVALVQCTSPKLKSGWVSGAIDGLKYAPIVATAARLTFKPTAVYVRAGGVFVRACTHLPAASVARQLLPESVRITGAVEAFHTDALDFTSFWDAGIMAPLIVSEEEASDVDTVKDLEKAVQEIKDEQK